MDLPDCILTHDKEGVLIIQITENIRGQEIVRITYPNFKMRRNYKFYVSFYWDGYRHYADHIKIGIPFVARKTKDYQYYSNSHRYQQIRLDKVVRSTRNRHAKSLY